MQQKSLETRWDSRLFVSVLEDYDFKLKVI
jgi:hypothetical protein